ncbi:lytic polysaccharide monooxygenase [Zasmidium cellare ATCC 36951]|uniref:Lytic polysaccharide monooxygenase n=1 Tax=Zasmidium cellare ATCC 36951 TaxID=1080233 RepID=A0A6A6C3A7_ZASCE|nr:lytic polysaccharide monooxygenase [Zasmidium cellare ATCC 36951]KAF2161393.1 lytic polysaccharide monooxygenase [Zasmidium cellare ATCC 36951]
MSIIQTTAVLASLAASVSAHGFVQGIVADGTYYEGYNPSFQYQSTPPTVAGWSDPENLSNGYIAPSAYADPDIVCHLSATPGGTAAKVAAGGTVELQWNTWPESHHGPVLDYLAPVSGEWADVDKSTLEFFKISEGGLIDGSSAPGKWASDDLIANNNTWAVTIPTGIAAGNYVLRHEIIALHSAGQADGAQNYPQCVNLEITGSGTDSPSGTLATTFYKEDDPGVLINIYTALSGYTIPGPALYSGAASGSQTAAPSSTAAAEKTGSASSVVAASTTAAAVSASSIPAYGSVTAPYANNSAPATSASFAASTTSAAAVETTPYTTVDQTTTAVETATATATSVATSAAYSEPASVAPAASETPTATSSSAPSPTGSDESQWGERPSKDLPEGWTLKDLEQWVAYLTKPSWNQGVHARDFKRFAAKMP